MFLRQLTDRLRQSLWFVPAVGLVLAVVAAVLMLLLSQWIASFSENPPLIFGGGPESARGILQVIAGSVVTVTGVVFSITVIALQLTSTQYSPRVLRNFMRDRPTQLTLAVFMGTIAYSLLILRTIRSVGPNGEPAFVPGLAVSGAVVLVFVSLMMLIYFIHHTGTRIQVSSIIESIATETLATARAVQQLFEPMRARELVGADLELTSPRHVRARRSGYLQYLDVNGLLGVAHDKDLRVNVLVPPGGWVQEGAPLYAVEAAADTSDDDLADWLVGKAALGSQRSMQQDIGFGVQQLVDIAVKALSPGINDPTTATQCVDRLTQVLVAVAEGDPLPAVLADEDGTPRLAPRFPSFGQLLRQSMEQVRHYGGRTPVVARHLALALRMLAQAVPVRHHPAIEREAEMLAEHVGAMSARDRAQVEALLREIPGA